MKVLILGGAGMLGHMLFRILSKHVDTYVTFRNDDTSKYIKTGFFQDKKTIYGIDALKYPSVVNAIESLKPNVVINCIGIIKQLEDSKNAGLSIEINALLPYRLMETCRLNNAYLIHFSTDCVFSGLTGNYKETDHSDAKDIYGRTKFLGEVQSNNALTIRTSIVGTELESARSLFDWFLSNKESKVNGYSMAIYTGMTTLQIGKEVLRIIERSPLISGLYHIASPKISKFELLCLLKRQFKLPISIEPNYDFYCDRSLDGSKYNLLTGYKAPSWEKMIEEFYMDRMNNYKWKQ